MDGTSGALYSIFLHALTSSTKQQSQSSSSAIPSTAFWARVLISASQTLSQYTPAKIGDRTLMDALLPFIEALERTGDVRAAAKAAADGAEHTKAMRASLGRTVYLGGEDEWRGKIPDPGAWGLGKFFEGLAGSF